MNSRQLKRLWPSVRDSINTMTRNSNYAIRQREITTSNQDRVERENAERESALLQRISTLERERDESRIAANYMLSQFH